MTPSDSDILSMMGDPGPGKFLVLHPSRKRKGRKWNTASEAKLLKFVENNPGLTASMIAILWRRPYGTISAVLHGMSEKRLVDRRQGPGMRGGKAQAWRYYKSATKEAVETVLGQV